MMFYYNTIILKIFEYSLAVKLRKLFFFKPSKFRLPKLEKFKIKKARIPDSNKVGIIMVILAILRRYSV